MRFLVDMPVSPHLVNWLNEKGHNALSMSQNSVYTKRKTKRSFMKQENRAGLLLRRTLISRNCLR